MTHTRFKYGACGNMIHKIKQGQQPDRPPPVGTEPLWAPSVSCGKAGDPTACLADGARSHPSGSAELVGRLSELAREWCAGLQGEPISATVMSAQQEDLFRMAGDGGPVQGFDASLELELHAPDADTHFQGWSREVGSRLDSLVQPELSVAQVGAKKVFRTGEPTSIRYQYCMKRRDDFTAEAYLRYYAEEHSRFGLSMEGIQGIYPDPSGSRRYGACHPAFGLFVSTLQQCFRPASGLGGCVA